MASPQPLVSIVTPCLNPGSRLERCLSSVAAQTYSMIEHIVVDGGSRDGTVELLERTPAVRWISEPDDGQSQAINKGFRMATGTIVGWLNADDTLQPEAVALAVEALESAPECGWAYGDLEVIERSSATIRRVPRTITLEGLERIDLVPQPGSLIRRAALDAVGGLDESFDLAMDYDLWMRLLAADYRGIHAGEILATFEIHAESKTSSRGGEAFALEDFRVMAKAGRPHGARLALDRWYWSHTYETISQLLVEGRTAEARSRAREALSIMEPVVSRRRLSLLVTRIAPWALRRRRLRQRLNS